VKVVNNTNKKHLAFFNETKSSFDSELLKENNLNNLINKLKNWIQRLTGLVHKLPKKFFLEEVSPFLSDFQNGSIDVPGQYYDDNEPAPDFHVRIERFQSELSIRGFDRCLQIRENNGRMFPFKISFVPDIKELFGEDHAEERSSQLLRMIGHYFNKHKEIRRRNVFFNVPSSVSLGPRIKMTQIDLDYQSLMQIYENFCDQTSAPKYGPLDYARKELTTDNSTTRTRVYQETSKMVPDHILTTYLNGIVPSATQLFTFKKQFLGQYALYAFVSHILGIGNRGPQNISLSKTTGNVVHSQFYPVYNENGIIKYNESVPFRLTRNLQKLFHPIQIESIFGSVITAAALCLSHYKDQLKHQLVLYLKEDLTALDPPVEYFDGENPRKKEEADFRKKLRTRVEANTNTILEKIKSLTPTVLPDKPTIPMNKKLMELIEISQMPENLSQMNAAWLPFS